MDKDKRELEEVMAKSSTEKMRLKAQQNDQLALLSEHFKKNVSISDPLVGKEL